MNNNILFAIILIGVLVFATKQPIPAQPAQEQQQPTPSDYTSLIDAGISVTGQRMFETGTSLRNENVKIIRLDGGTTRTDLGYFSLDSTAIAVTPNVKYRLYYFMNESPSINYYVDVEDYTGKQQDAVDNIYGTGCTIDNTPTFWVHSSDGSTQTASANAQAISASGSAEVTLFIKSDWKECYGMPDAKGTVNQNAVCFLYTSAPFSSIDTNTGKAASPKSIRTSGNASNKVVECYKFPSISNSEIAEIPVTIKASGTEPTIAHNITVMSEDICLDLNVNNLGEIWGYEDEVGNNLCAPQVHLGTIYIS